MADEFKTTDVEELRSALMSVDDEVMSSISFPELIPFAARAIRKYAKLRTEVDTFISQVNSALAKIQTSAAPSSLGNTVDDAPSLQPLTASSKRTSSAAGLGPVVLGGEIPEQVGGEQERQQQAPAGSTASSAAPTSMLTRVQGVKSLFSSSNLDSAAGSIPASFSGLGLPTSDSEAFNPSTTTASTVALAIPLAIASTVSASASAPARFVFSGKQQQAPIDPARLVPVAVMRVMGAAPPGSVAEPTAPTAPVPVPGLSSAKPLSDSTANSIPASPFGPPAASGSEAFNPSTTVASAASSILPFTGFGASSSKTPGIASTVPVSASAPAFFGGEQQQPPAAAVDAASAAVSTLAPSESLTRFAAPSSSGNPLGGGLQQQEEAHVQEEEAHFQEEEQEQAQDVGEPATGLPSIENVAPWRPRN